MAMIRGTVSDGELSIRGGGPGGSGALGKAKRRTDAHRESCRWAGARLARKLAEREGFEPSTGFWPVLP